MADREKDAPRQPTHRAYSVIRREGQDDFWLNVGLVFPHKDDGGFNIMLQAFPLDGKIVCRQVTDDDAAADTDRGSGQPERSERPSRRGSSSRS
jgi:hypothetical protein